MWVILDGGRKISTGCDYDDVAGAERQLGLYIAGKERPQGPRHPDHVGIAEVIRLYALDIAPQTARVAETAARLRQIMLYFGEQQVSYITGATCRAFAATRKPSAARRQLEDLRSALKHYAAEGYLEIVPVVSLPDKEQPRERWLTRSEAARLIWAAWRAREVQKGVVTSQRPGRHVARFMLVALYTGTRAGAVCAASWDQFDFEAGIFYRRPEGEKETKKRRPPVPIPDRLLAHMKRWKVKGGNHPVEWRGFCIKRISKAFAKAAAAAGMPDVHPHVLRHTAATWLMREGCSLETASRFLGMTVKVLEDRYWHHHPDYLKEAAKAIGQRRIRTTV
jgi:integrase